MTPIDQYFETSKQRDANDIEALRMHYANSGTTPPGQPTGPALFPTTDRRKSRVWDLVVITLGVIAVLILAWIAFHRVEPITKTDLGDATQAVFNNTALQLKGVTEQQEANTQKVLTAINGVPNKADIKEIVDKALDESEVRTGRRHDALVGQMNGLSNQISNSTNKIVETTQIQGRKTRSQLSAVTASLATKSDVKNIGDRVMVEINGKAQEINSALSKLQSSAQKGAQATATAQDNLLVNLLFINENEAAVGDWNGLPVQLIPAAEAMVRFQPNWHIARMLQSFQYDPSKPEVPGVITLANGQTIEVLPSDVYPLDNTSLFFRNGYGSYRKVFGTVHFNP